jgi:hypothetical protein
MGTKVLQSEILEIITEHKTRSNKDIQLALEFIQKDFEVTKETLVKLSNHLDKLEVTYNTLLKEYNTRNGSV